MWQLHTQHRFDLVPKLVRIVLVAQVHTYARTPPMVHRAFGIETENLRAGVEPAGGVDQVGIMSSQERRNGLNIERATELEAGDKVSCRQRSAPELRKTDGS